jgi:hypothetical protein
MAARDVANAINNQEVVLTDDGALCFADALAWAAVAPKVAGRAKLGTDCRDPAEAKKLAAAARRENPGRGRKNRLAWAALSQAPEGSEWRVLGLARRARKGRCLCGHKATWVCYVATETGTVLNLGLDCLKRGGLCALLPDAQALKFQLRQSVRAGEPNAVPAPVVKCSRCGAASRTGKKWATLCLECYRREQLAISDRSCPTCGARIPKNKNWWQSCYDCFLRQRLAQGVAVVTWRPAE